MRPLDGKDLSQAPGRKPEASQLQFLGSNGKGAGLAPLASRIGCKRRVAEASSPWDLKTMEQVITQGQGQITQPSWPLHVPVHLNSELSHLRRQQSAPFWLIGDGFRGAASFCVYVLSTCSTPSRCRTLRGAILMLRAYQPLTEDSSSGWAWGLRKR